jgi:hypothetical protein
MMTSPTHPTGNFQESHSSSGSFHAYLRNPLQNWKYVLRVADQNYGRGYRTSNATIWSDVDPVKTGWKVSTIRTDWLRLPLFPMRRFRDLVRWLAMVRHLRV